MIEYRCISSLEKVRLQQAPACAECLEGSALQGECFSFQIAFRGTPDESFASEVRYSVASDLGDCISVRLVKNVPVDFPGFPNRPEITDDYVLSKDPGLYPDILQEMIQPVFKSHLLYWHSLWISVELPEDVTPGRHSIVFSFDDGKNVSSKEFVLTVADAVLPLQELPVTMWFHSDCLSSYYHLEVFSSDYWTAVENFLKTAVKNGINMILTPVFTPPLDTAIGGERPTVQLVDIEDKNGVYQFDFHKLDQWINLCRKVGVRYFEICQMFTQWGAKACPKIMVRKNGVLVNDFGWDTPANSTKYQNFLAHFLPALCQALQANGVLDHCFFHISDEPTEETLEGYKKAVAMVKPYATGCRFIDALSSYRFYAEGLVDHPVVAIDHIRPFIEHKAENLWAYYCCGQGKNVSNRFIPMPGERNRILGILLYKYDIRGFLQWGYNFYYSGNSKKLLDPYEDTGGEMSFPAGDPFIVYPGKELTPVESMRLVVFREAIQDYRACKKLESKVGREKVIALLDQEAHMEVTFQQYPHSPEYLLQLRQKINAML